MFCYLEFNNVILGMLDEYLKPSKAPPLEGFGEAKKIKAYGQLVLLSFSVTTFTPVAYQRHSL